MYWQTLKHYQISELKLLKLETQEKQETEENLQEMQENLEEMQGILQETQDHLLHCC